MQGAVAKLLFCHSPLFVSRYPRLDTLALLLNKLILRIPGFYVCAFCSLRDYKLKIVWRALEDVSKLSPFRRIIPFKYDTRQVSTPAKDSHSKARYRAGDVDTR